MRARRRQSPDQAQKDIYLFSRIAVGQVARELSRVGVDDGQIERSPGLCAGLGMARDEAAVVELGCRRADTPDQADMHERPQEMSAQSRTAIEQSQCVQQSARLP